MSNIDPVHYNHHKIQPRDFITENNLGYNVGNIIKYVCRFKKKNGLEDLLKARNYLNYLIEIEQAKVNKDDEIVLD